MKLRYLKTGIIVLSLGVGVQVSATHQHRLHHKNKKHHNHCVDKTWEIYGQLDKAVQAVGDTNARRVQVVDNHNAASLVGFLGEARNKRLTIGSHFETSFTGPSSKYVSQHKFGPSGQYSDGVNGRGPYSLKLRYADLWVRNHLGTLSLGKGSMASDESSRSSFSGADIIANADVSSMAGGYLFHIRGNDEVYGYENRVGEVFKDINGFGRKNRIRYDFPTYQNFTVSGSIANSDRYLTMIRVQDTNWTYREKLRVGQRYLADLAVRYQEQFSDFDTKAALAFGRTSYGNSLSRDRLWDGSVAVLHRDSGFNFAFAMGRRTNVQELPAVGTYGPNNPAWPHKTFHYVQAGKQYEFCRHGKTNFVVDYWYGKNYLAYNVDGNNARVVGVGAGGQPQKTAGGNRSTSVGFAVVQELEKLNTDVYAGWRSYRFKVPAHIAKVDNEPISAAMLGFRIHFSKTS